MCMILRLLNRTALVLLILVLSSNLTMAQTEEKKELVWVLIETRHSESDTSQTEHSHLMRAHMDYLSKMHSNKKMLSSLSFQGGGGLMFFESNIDSIKVWLQHDPAVANGLFRLTYYIWIPQKGKLCQSDKSSRLSNVHVAFLNHKPDQKVDEALEKNQRDLVSTLNELSSMAFIGKLKEGSSYAFISKDGVGMNLLPEFVKNYNSNFEVRSYKAWAPDATFCE